MKRIIFLTASWCTVCSGLYPIIQKLQKEGNKIEIISMDNDEGIEFANNLNVRSVPSIINIRGNDIKVMVGLHNEDEIRSFIK